MNTKAYLFSAFAFSMMVLLLAPGRACQAAIIYGIAPGSAPLNSAYNEGITSITLGAATTYTVRLRESDIPNTNERLLSYGVRIFLTDPSVASLTLESTISGAVVQTAPNFLYVAGGFSSAATGINLSGLPNQALSIATFTLTPLNAGSANLLLLDPLPGFADQFDNSTGNIFSSIIAGEDNFAFPNQTLDDFGFVVVRASSNAGIAINVAAVPEPASLSLMAISMAGGYIFRRKLLNVRS